MMGPDDYPAVKRYLYSLKNRGARYGIERMEVLVRELGHPERRFPIIHIAGTNGKGSTTAILESIYRAAGLRTGMFTSPHLVYQGERVQVNRNILSHDAIVSYTARIRAAGESIARVDAELFPSFFEFMTAMAFMRFADEAVDIGIIETGLGGRLDATNVVCPEVSVITSIGFDHCDILGDTLAKIATEKAGIIKPGKPVVIGWLPPEAEAVIRARAQALGCAVHSVKERFGEDLQSYPVPALEGDYQRMNAATALTTIEVLAAKFNVSQQAINVGLANVRWPGRWEHHALADREIILDATHNSEGVVWLERNLRALVEHKGYRPVIVTGTLGMMRAQAIMPVLAKYAREIILLQPRQPRACSFAELRSCIPADFAGKIQDCDLKQIFPRPGVCTVGLPGDTIVATGSIYLLGEIMEAVYHESPIAEYVLQD
ncbi:MAG: bifunctional folylpolyglutamate synthase/dihydrofolate synthase [Verrucomicrobia bacterium]|nr:bifunctional folylpolyglutamate synthase/dihydrofolate synthase [Verrucomicrobiota bacterium]